MSEGEITIIRQAITTLSNKVDAQFEAKRLELKELSDKADRQHAENQRSQQQDRETFRSAIAAQQQTFFAAMEAQRSAFQDALSRQFSSHTELDKVVDRHSALLASLVGKDGQPEEGRIGLLETGLETMKKFRWQAIALISLGMWGVEVWLHSTR